MADLNPAPNWMHPLPEVTPALPDALAACVEAYRDHDVPTQLCRQCLSEDMEARIIAAAHLARAGQTPAHEDFAQIYFEHPNCVGGEDTIKLFMPYGLELMLTGTPPPGFGQYSYPERLDTALRAGFWFWPQELITPVRLIAARLFHDWFSEGRFDLKGGPHSDMPVDDLLGPGDNIMTLCIMCLIDPVDLIQRLGQMHTPWSDEMMTSVGNCTLESPFYLSTETGTKHGPYKAAADAIAASLAAREALGFLNIATREWLQLAFDRREQDYPALAADLSNLENYYDVQTVQIRKSSEGAILENWPDLPLI